ncbi:TonB-dependent receptor [Telluribacter humicola]|uniref:TonB-dependent receptor domain-containing protein n=1 Tax=Telluribacter humicola TaxID=1720261 RepID=UPI001A96A392|nr:TonB-dependent receptor [Telluribacter humicola]
MKLMHCILLLSAALLSVGTAYAQIPDDEQSPAPSPQTTTTQSTAGEITGRLLHEQDGERQPVPFASVALFKTSDSSAVAGAITDEKGFFTITGIPDGNFYMLIQSLGFTTFRRENISISPGAPSVQLGTVMLKQNARQLEEVNVTGQKALVEYNLDRKVINVDRLPATLGGSALDIMQNVPSVTVDMDGNLSLRGSENVIILVNGKPSGLTGLDRQAILEQIPASSIESIEVITNPSSKYDADGAAGILNIILKKEQSSGFNGTAQLNVGTRDKYNASINLNNRVNEKLNLYTSYNFRDVRRFNYRIMDRENFRNEELRYLEQRTDGISRDLNNNLRFGFDWDATSKFALTGSIMYRPEYDRDRDQTIYNNFDLNRQLSQRIVRSNDEEEREAGFDYQLGIRKKFAKPKRLLSMDATLATSNGTEVALFNQSTFGANGLPSDPALQQRNTRTNNNRIGVIQLDFLEPLKNNGKFETGLKYTNRYLDGDFLFENRIGDVLMWQIDERLTNNFIYDEHTSAAYANFGTEMKKWSYQVGLRLENTLLNTEQRTTGESAQQNYTYLFPSAFLNYDISKTQKMQVNYTRRINRPWVRALNPFVDLSDPLNISYGNPNLRPELINSFELSHLWYGKSTSLTTSTFYRASTDDVTRYRRLREDGVTEQTFLNLARSYSYGIELVANQDIVRWWKANGNFSYFFRSIIGGDPDLPNVLTQTNRSWTARVNNSFTFAKGFDGQLSVNYRSPFIIPQGEILGFFNVDFGMKKDVMNGRGTVNLRVSDIFNTLKFRIRTYGEGFESYMLGKRETRIAFIGFTYRFGKQIKQLQREREQRGDGGDGDMEDF